MAKGPLRLFLKRRRNDLLVGFFYTCTGCLRLFPMRVATFLCACLGRLCYTLLTRERNWGLQNLEDALGADYSPAQRRKILKRAFANMGRNVAEIVLIDRIMKGVKSGREDILRISPESGAIMKKLREDGKGFIFVSGHIANWELIGITTVLLGLGGGNIIAKPFFEPRIDEWIRKKREVEGNIVLQRGSPNMGLVIARGLRKGKNAGFLIDQDTTVPGDFVPFFHKEAWTPTGPALFSSRFRIHAVVAAMQRLPDGSHEMKLLGVVDPPENTEEAIREATAQYTKLLEGHIRSQPEQWIWFHRRWKRNAESRYVIEYRASHAPEAESAAAGD